MLQATPRSDSPRHVVTRGVALLCRRQLARWLAPKASECAGSHQSPTPASWSPLPERGQPRGVDRSHSSPDRAASQTSRPRAQTVTKSLAGRVRASGPPVRFGAGGVFQRGRATCLRARQSADTAAHRRPHGTIVGLISGGNHTQASRLEPRLTPSARPTNSYRFKKRGLIL